MYYFDNAATSYPKPEQVYRFMDEYYRNNGFNSNRSTIRTEKSPSQIIEDTRKLILDFFNAENKVVTLLASATEAMNVVLQGLEYHDINNIYISPFEHNAVLRALHHLKTIHSFELIQLAMDRTSDKYDLEGIKYQFQKKKPDLMIINHASNVTGLIAPIHELCKIAKKYKAETVIDIAQTAGQIEVDLKSSDIDYAIFTGHKSLLGSFGIGGFISKPDKYIKPLLYGGTGKDSTNLDLPSTTPEKYEVGSKNILAIASLYAALNWFYENDFKRIISEKKKKTQKLIKLLEEYPDITVYREGEADNYVNVVSCNYSGYSSDSFGEILSQKGIVVRTGLHCAPNAHKYIGTFPEGTVRFSVGYFTSDDDLNELEDVLDFIEENS